jgi:dihydroneopterin aldolase
VSDRIVLANMRFEGRHGVLPEEQETPQPFEVDVELALDLRPAGVSDDLSRTVDYRGVFDACRDIVEGPSRRLLESLAESIASRLLSDFEGAGISKVVVRVRKPAVLLPGRLDYASVEVKRSVRKVRQKGHSADDAPAEGAN